MYYCNGNHHWPCLCLQGIIVAVGTLQSQLAMIADGMSLQLVENQKSMLLGILMTNQCCCLIMKDVTESMKLLLPLGNQMTLTYKLKQKVR